MEDLNILQLIAVPLLTGVVASIITVVFTRKNLKTTKYIDTITIERIKWIQILRNDFSELMQSILIRTKNYTYLSEIKNEKIRQDLMHELTSPYNEPTEEYLQNYSELRNNVIQSDKEINSVLKRVEIVNKALLIKLKMNPKDDVEIIKDLNGIIDFFSNYSNEMKDFKLNLDLIINNVQWLLKREWDKVKSEVRRK